MFHTFFFSKTINFQEKKKKCSTDVTENPKIHDAAKKLAPLDVIRESVVPPPWTIPLHRFECTN